MNDVNEISSLVKILVERTDSLEKELNVVKGRITELENVDKKVEGNIPSKK